MSSNFKEHCEKLWQRWIARELELSHFIKTEFETEYMPEPYLRFHSGNNPLYVLTTNPGGGMSMQHRENINNQSIVIQKESDYHSIAFSLGSFYLNKLEGPAKRRIDSFIKLSALGGFNSVIQIEACPFHSRNLNKKNELLKQFKKDLLLIEYEDLLRKSLKKHPVIALSAVNSKAPITLSGVANNAWLNWLAGLIDLNLHTAKVLSLTEKNSETSSAFVYNDERETLSGIVLKKGSNNFPKMKAMKPIVELLRRQNSA